MPTPTSVNDNLRLLERGDAGYMNEGNPYLNYGAIEVSEMTDTQRTELGPANS